MLDIKTTEVNTTCGNLSIKGIDSNSRCITGGNNHLYPHIKEAMSRAVSIDIIVSFVMESGVRLLEDDFKNIVESGKKTRILTGNYLNITQPSALYLMRDIMGDKADIRFYSDKRRSFHPKAYIFHYENGDGDIFIGSSNISRSAMKKGIEWNYRIRKEGNEEDFNTYLNEFERLFLNEAIIVDDEELKRYSEAWVRPKVYKQLEEKEPDYEKVHEKNKSEDLEPKEIEKVEAIFKPRGAQIEALYELNRKREDENLDKALVVAATGIGKTYLAAFDSMNFNKILFVAHREEILKQAERTFKTVRPEANTGFFMNIRKDTNSDIVFASVQTLGKKNYLSPEYFPENYFDYIVIDESHHVVANNYKNIINYFKPSFMIGLTATPDRLDNKDVYSLFDYNVAYEVNLKSAINKGWLVPFRYYGIYDDSIDYEKIDCEKGHYDIKQLEEALSVNKRVDLIMKHYKKFISNRALGFCSNKAHAEYMAKAFTENGVKACAVYSGDLGEYAIERNKALKKFKNGEIKVIFSVDMFNEGLDIKSVDMVMFLRPTESPTVFLQQLGRGLRKDENKNHLNVLDFIGNFKKANLIPFLLKGTREGVKAANRKKGIPREEEFPEDCLVDFDISLIDLFEKMEQSQKKIQELVIDEFYKVRADLEKIPSRTELFTYMDDDIYENMKKRKNINFFKGYLAFLNKNKELSEEEKALMGTIAENFINMIEETSMTKTYKMPVLLAFYNNGNIKMRINDDDLYKSFKDFYSKGTNGTDLTRDGGTVFYKSWGKKEYVSLAKKNPVKYLLKSSSEFFHTQGEEMCLNEELKAFIENEAFIKHFKDAVDFRASEFYKSRLEKSYER